MMANKQLATYLNNHLAASVAALEVLSSLEKAQSDGDDVAPAAGDSDIAHFAAELRAEIETEQKELESVMERLEITKDRPRQAAGWIAEKFAQLKLQWDSSKEGSLYQLESLELLLIGIEGKRGLWRALAAAEVPGLPVTEYEQFAQRSENQQRRVESYRLAAAKVAFATPME